MAVHWSMLSGDFDNGKLISPKGNNGDFDYWLVLEICDLHDAMGEKEAPAKYSIDVAVVAPSEVSAKERKQALQSYGVMEEELSKFGPPFDAIVDVLHSYGTRAIIYSACGERLADLIREAKKQAEICGNFFFGFSMDAPQNAIGTTGWEMIRGDLLAPLLQ